MDVYPIEEKGNHSDSRACRKSEDARAESRIDGELPFSEGTIGNLMDQN